MFGLAYCECIDIHPEGPSPHLAHSQVITASSKPPKCSSQPANCSSNATTANKNCMAATMMLHVTTSASGYFENIWAWVSDQYAIPKARSPSSDQLPLKPQNDSKMRPSPNARLRGTDAKYGNACGFYVSRSGNRDPQQCLFIKQNNSVSQTRIWNNARSISRPFLASP